jgi:hypothetical protein
VLSSNHCYSGKVVWIAYYVCTFSLSFPTWKAHAPCYIVICDLSGSTEFFPHYLINGKIFGKKLLNVKFLFWFTVQTLSETFLLLRRIRKYVIINMCRFSYKIPGILVRLSRNLSFLDRFSKNTPMRKFIKVRPVGTEIFYADRETDGKTDGRTDMTKLIIAFLPMPNSFSWDIKFSK